MNIIGAGMAGLLAGNMLRKKDPYLLEALPKLPDNHGALLRFRSKVVAEATGQKFREVRVMKAVRTSTGSMSSGPPDLAQANRYSIKVTGAAMPRSIMNLDPSQRWIAPCDFLESLAKGLDIRFSFRVDSESLMNMIEDGKPIISTIPMGALMSMMPGWKDRAPPFPSTQIWSLRTRVKKPFLDIHQTVYYPGAEPYYRASITGDLLTVEYLTMPEAEDQDKRLQRILRDDFGIDAKILDVPEVYHQPLGKIRPIDEEARREFIVEMTDRYRIYSLGRFAIWKQILLDDVVQDIQRIDRWITDRNFYGRRKENWTL